ncbi:AAA-like domain-containing protein [Leptolyngbya sp. AN03gr2]|uniref:AAA-like domain-containing protein n=1 Tax=unclassified Leptolyngbya TaxID=2650499 RepID=UPI003D31F7B0
MPPRKSTKSTQRKVDYADLVSRRIFISYRSQDPDRSLAAEFQRSLIESGHTAFMAGESIRLGENWSDRIDTELQQCDYLLLLLSPQSAVSEMVTEEVRRARELRDTRDEKRPILLPIRVNFPFDSPLNYDLRGYLQRIQQREWKSELDTTKILQEVLELVGTNAEWIAEQREEPAVLRQDRPDDPPLPIAEPELDPELYREPGGAVALESDLYVERGAIEADCYREILQPGALIRIKAPRQMGKTSLMARTLDHARQQGCQTISFSFQRADRACFSDLDLLLRWFCQQVGRRLKRLSQLEDSWKIGGSKDKCSDYFLDCLEELEQPLVIAMDEVDLVFPYREVADDFFALLRSWFDAARIGDSDSELWRKLRLMIVHSTEAYVPLDMNQSPFNVGKNVDLEEFTRSQVQELAQRYRLQDEVVDEIATLVGGHPYLVRKAFYHLRRQDATLEQLKQTAATEAGIYSDHLRRHLLNLRTYPQLVEALRQVVVKSKPVELEAEPAFKLESMGLIALQGNEARPRCELYRSYFQDHLKT